MQPRCLISSIALGALAAIIATPAGAQTLRGSPASVDLMYTTAQMRDLQFLRTTSDIYEAARTGALKLISVTEDLELDRATFPFVLPNTLRFADSLAAEYHKGCGERIGVTSGARPIDKQPRNASPKSVHPTGMAVDFRRPQNPVCLEWLRTALVDLEDRHVVEATEEHHPPHFHVAVLRQAPEPRITMLAAANRDSAAAGRVRTAAGEVDLKPVAKKKTVVKKKTAAKRTHRKASAQP
jgi:hypothetical protein